MNWLHLLSYFFGGAFAANAIPHFVAGTQGRAFQSPFAKPPGKGLSSATTNVVWAIVNAALAWVLVLHVGDFHLRYAPHAVALLAGAAVLGLQLAYSFGPIYGGNLQKQA